MQSRPSILLIDDGELEDVRAQLDELGEVYVRLPGAHVPEHPQAPRLLFVTTFRRALSAAPCTPQRDEGGRPLRIAIGPRGSETEREALRRTGVDLLVYRPVHGSVLRLLLLWALYEGEEKRQGTRIPVGCAITYGADVRTTGAAPEGHAYAVERHEGILAEFSVQGCRIVATRPGVGTGEQIWVELPGAVTGDQPLRVRGRVVATEAVPTDGWNPSVTALGVEFERVTPKSIDRLQRVVADRASGSATPWEAVPSRAGASSVVDWENVDRRRLKRVNYPGDVVAIHGGVSVLMGCDLSSGGMRVERHSMLAVGDHLRLSIAVNEDGPLILDSNVERDDGDRGFVLRFDSPDDATKTRLDHLIQALPAVESVGRPDAGAILLTEVVGS
jgi:hypothetical protein